MLREDNAKQDIHLDNSELEAIWTWANMTSSKQFRTTFSSGLYQGISKIEHDKDYVCESLYYAAKNGNFEKFKYFFIMGIVSANGYYLGGNQGRTFLYAIVKHDVQPEHHPATIGRKNIARYLLEKGADMDLKSYGLAGDDKLSPWDMYENYKNRHDNKWRNTLTSFFSYTPQYGVNIFPILKEHRERVAQLKSDTQLKMVVVV